MNPFFPLKTAMITCFKWLSFSYYYFIFFLFVLWKKKVGNSHDYTHAAPTIKCGTYRTVIAVNLDQEEKWGSRVGHGVDGQPVMQSKGQSHLSGTSAEN